MKLDDIPVESLQTLFTYWNEIRGSRAMPARVDIEPARLASILPMLVLIDVESDPMRFKIRLMGSENVKVAGEDMTGRYIETLNSYDRLYENLTWLVDNRLPYLACGTVDWRAKNYMSYHTLGLPLSDNDRDVNMILFGFYYFFNNAAGNGGPQQI
ncbi:PAS domain-containing protein [Emcibacter nanhaiensis]|uniref:PAS domain-containing protein n=1 Tax=Emcibacter nanhaiensis TaxID=1505037 RepID=UPI001C6116C6|nr:PAS domain-containing protein [Emcibacter nanhaiensis]